MAVDQALVDLYDSYLDDFKLFASDLLTIKSHDAQALVPFEFNEGQNIIHEVIEKRKAEQGYVRALLLKARRFGGSTYVEGRLYWLASLNYNRDAFIIGHEVDSTDTLYQMARLFHERNTAAPQTRKSNAKELIFDNDQGTGLKSQYSLACARNLAAGRSQGIHYLHGSEMAYWGDNAGILLDGLLSCVPDPPAESEVYLESTANGFGNRFQTDCFTAYGEGRYPYYQRDGITYAWTNPDTDWILIFVPWFVHSHYSRKFESEKHRQAFEAEIKAKVLNRDTMAWEDSDAIKLQRKFQLSLEQLYWRKWAILNKCSGNLNTFKQEYPSTVEEAFIATGSNVYSAELCDVVEAACKPPILVGDVVERMGQPRIRPNPHGHFSVWAKPGTERKDTYFLTVDTAGGKNERQKEKKITPDYTVIDVWHHYTGEQVAQWHGHIDYDLVADLVELIGRMYHDAPACVELQNHGFTVVADLKRKRYPMYEAHPGEAGWLTNSKTKPAMVDGLFEAARDGVLQIRCRETVSEMRTYAEESGKYGAEAGCKDDRVMTAAMASQMMTLLHRSARKDEREERRKGKDKPAFIANRPDRGHPGPQKDRNSGNYQEVYVR